MAVEEHVKILRQGVEAWNEWRDKNPEIDPDLSNEYLISSQRSPLRGINLSLTNLTGADLRGVDFIRSNLYSADLSGANLQFAHLRVCDLGSANLADADLRNVRVDGSIFFCTNLVRANLRSALLMFPRFAYSNLRDADFSEAQLAYAIFNNTNLDEAKGLDKIIHGGPSSVGIDIIYLSKGNIPEIFLRGCGVPEVFITHIPSLVAGAQPIQFYSCFISYSHADKSFARRLHDALQGKGIRCWLDKHKLLPGDKIYTEVDRGIRLWDKVLLCCSKESLKSWWVENEIQIAFEKEQQVKQERGQDVLALIPLNLDGYLFGGEWKSELATQIKSRLAADFTGWETDNSKFESEFEKLVKALRADAGGRESPPPSKL